jgi:hypothetical protein
MREYVAIQHTESKHKSARALRHEIDRLPWHHQVGFGDGILRGDLEAHPTHCLETVYAA